MSIILTDEQSNAVRCISNWFNSKMKHQFPFVLAGLAGTGKTVLAKFIIDELKLSESTVAFCAYTGKAAMVLRRKGIPATTIHSLIYEPYEEIDGNIRFQRKPSINCDIKLIIVDEASMVGKELQEDLQSYGIPVCYIGDHGQLPPISDDMSNLMLKPHFKLETIHRQALDNPIIYVADLARRGINIKHGSYGKNVIKLPKEKVTMDSLMMADQVLCGKNLTRQHLNKHIRTAHGRNVSDFPITGDKLICLKNNHDNGLINGMTGFCKTYNTRYNMLTFENEAKEVFGGLEIDTEIFLSGKNSGYSKKIEQFDFGYCITTHKAQGSEFSKVIVFEERLGFDYDMHNRWLYTAITRAVDKLIIAS